MNRRPNTLWAIMFLTCSACTPPAPIQQRHEVSMPPLLVECDGAAQCKPEGMALWNFQGAQGQGKWIFGALANLSVEQFDRGGVIIHRIDPPNSTSPGLTARYTGTLHDGHIDGDVTWTSASGRSVFKGHWSATLPIDPVLAQNQWQQTQNQWRQQQMASQQQQQAGQSMMLMGLMGAMMGGAMMGGGGGGSSDGDSFERSERQYLNNEHRTESGTPGTL